MQNNKQIALKKSLSSAKKTFLFQLGTAVLSLCIGIGIITLVTKGMIAIDLGLRYSDNSKFDFFAEALWVTSGYVFLVGFCTYQQFKKALGQKKILPYCLKASVYIGAVVVGFSAFILLIFARESLTLLLISSVFVLFFLLVLGLLVGTLQIIRLKWEKFNPATHLWLLTHEADVLACQSSQLPYRQQIQQYWNLIFVIFMLLMSVASFYVLSQNGALLVGCGLSTGLILVFLYMLLTIIGLISDPNIYSREMKVEKKIIRKSWGQYRMSMYFLICDGQEYQTNSQTWHSVIESKTYRLWFSRVNSNILATELLS